MEALLPLLLVSLFIFKRSDDYSAIRIRLAINADAHAIPTRYCLHRGSIYTTMETELRRQLEELECQREEAERESVAASRRHFSRTSRSAAACQVSIARY